MEHLQSPADMGILRARDAFLRDLPALLANPKWDRWCVAYCGEERIALAETQREVLRECQRLGRQLDQVFVGCIVPHSKEEEEVDTGFYEFDDIEHDKASSGAGPIS